MGDVYMVFLSAKEILSWNQRGSRVAEIQGLFIPSHERYCKIDKIRTTTTVVTLSFLSPQASAADICLKISYSSISSRVRICVSNNALAVED
jgi:hypothetical protein